MFLPVAPFFSCADMTGAHPVTVSAGPSCETVSLTLKPPLLSTIISCTISEHLLLLHWNANPCSEYMLFSETTNHLYYKIYMHVYYIYTAFIHFFFLSRTCVLHKRLRWKAFIALWRKHIVSLGYLEVVNHPLDHVVGVQSGMNNPIRNGIVVWVAVRFPVIFSPLYKSIVPLDWIIVFHSTSFHLLISILHFIHCN